MTLKTSQVVSRHAVISPRISVDLTFGAEGMVCEWSGDFTTLSRSELARYIAVRNACASEFAKLIGSNTMLVDFDADGRLQHAYTVFFPDGRIEHRSLDER